MRRRSTAICLALAALVPAAAPAAAPAKKAKAGKPTITRVTPMRIRVGAVLTIRGKNFKAKRTKNTVIFRASNGRTAFAKPKRASRKKLVVVVPAALSRVLAGKPGRIKIRVLAGKFSAFTPRRLSPVVVPPGFKSGIGGGAASACAKDSFDDGDLMAGSTELAIGTDPCVKDTDGDGIEDGFEYQSAIDLNDDEYQDPNKSLPYPGKRPYPNPLDPSDAGQDNDGDTLSQRVEQDLWRYTVANGAPRRLNPAGNQVTGLTYSDGEQYSVAEHRDGYGDRRWPTLDATTYDKQKSFLTWASSAGYLKVYLADGKPWHKHDAPDHRCYYLLDVNRTYGKARSAPDAPGLCSSVTFDVSPGSPERDENELFYFDLDGDRVLSDEERDEDADGLTNYDENTGRLTPEYWISCYSGEARERPYYVKYAGTKLTDPDSDNDKVRDGADDQDHDDVPNIMELSRGDAYKPGTPSGNPIEDGGDDRERERDCKLAEVVENSLPEDPPFYWHEDAYGRVQPFNPCVPASFARTCNNAPAFGSEWAPFDQSPDWLVLN
jgi:hypothetical protein